MLRVCPKCLIVSSEDWFCPNDGEKLVDPDELPPSRRPDRDPTGLTVPEVWGSSSEVAPRSAPRIGLSPLAETLPISADPLIGQVVAGRYRVLRQLGEGGMGNVYRAVQESIEKKVALKVLKAEYSSSPDMVVRFHREAVSACRIKHPNVVDVFDLGQLEDGRFYIAMDLLEGSDLAQVLAASSHLPPQRAVPIALQICRALNAAHQSGIIHRDLKPENVFLHRTSDGDEIVKIVDFGIAALVSQGPDRARSVPTPERASDGSRKLTSVGTIFGTPEYMAPEQATGGKVDHRADIYATGIILYKMLTGRVPFTANSFLDVLAKQVGEAPPRMSEVNPEVDVPKEIERVVRRALEKKSEDRYATMARFASALAYASRDLRGDARRRARRIAGALAVLVTSAAAMYGFLHWRETKSIAKGAPTASPSIAALATPPPSAELTPSPTAPTALPTPEVAVDDAGTLDAAIFGEGGFTALASAAPVLSAPAASAVKPLRVPPKPDRVITPSRAPAPAPGGASLPELERCFETIDGVRREVPCR